MSYLLLLPPLPTARASFGDDWGGTGGRARSGGGARMDPMWRRDGGHTTPPLFMRHAQLLAVTRASWRPHPRLQLHVRPVDFSIIRRISWVWTGANQTWAWTSQIAWRRRRPAIKSPFCRYANSNKVRQPTGIGWIWGHVGDLGSVEPGLGMRCIIHRHGPMGFPVLYWLSAELEQIVHDQCGVIVVGCSPLCHPIRPDYGPDSDKATALGSPPSVVIEFSNRTVL